MSAGRCIVDTAAELKATVERLRANGCPITGLESDGGRAIISIGPGSVAFGLLDPDRPTFTVTYPLLREKRNGRPTVVDVTADGVLFEGLEWIVKQVGSHGTVVPEFHSGKPRKST